MIKNFINYIIIFLLLKKCLKRQKNSYSALIHEAFENEKSRNSKEFNLQQLI